MKKINKITLYTTTDEYPDLEDLGTFADEPEEFAIHHSNDPGNYKYFNPSNVTNEEQAKWNYDRYLKFNTGYLSKVTIYAKAEISINGTLQYIESSGLCGVDSDSSNEYITSIRMEQLSELSEILKGIGFTDKKIGEAMFINSTTKE